MKHSYTKYIQIDIAGNPDIKLNLEKDLPLPFDDSSFDTVIAMDVLADRGVRPQCSICYIDW